MKRETVQVEMALAFTKRELNRFDLLCLFANALYEARQTTPSF